MTDFIQWLSELHNSDRPLLTKANIAKTIRDRDRLTRMEAMLHELIHLKQIIVDRRTT
jgi:hypothetical protein